MATKELDYRCWVLDYPAGVSDDGRHFKTASEARAKAYPPYQHAAVPRQRAAPCHLVICDGLNGEACGEELENSGDGWTVHAANPADVADYAVAEGWTANPDDTLTCYFCDEPDECADA